ncbi:nicastrin isoform X3 [Cryptotermes secundus]|nr:nicastrin isoform X3 [Cryptotermes secundus]
MASFMVICIVYLCVILRLSFPASAESIKDKMYESVEGAVACFRRLNGTHQFGCSSHRSGNVGVIHVIDSQRDLDWLLNKATADPYITVIQPEMFTRDVLLALKVSDKVNGVVLINNRSAERPEYFSHDDKCPNRYSGLARIEQTCNNSQPWNPHGTGLMFIDWGFPIFHIEDGDSISKLYQCYQKHNAYHRDEQRDQSLCALEMNSFMIAAVDSKTCMRRSAATTILNYVHYCDPLGGDNIWSTLYPRLKAEKMNRTVVVVAARLDGTSMFDGLVPGAMSPVSGIVTLLMTAKILASIAQNLSDIDGHQDNNVLFLLLNGESYDYIGSSRVVWDMEHGVFPMKPSSSEVQEPPPLFLQNIAMFIELGQISALGNMSGSNTTTLYFHQHFPTSNNVLNRYQMETFISHMKKYGSEVGLEFNLINEKRFPPASLQNFLAASSDIPGVLLADHGSQYVNRYYHSIMDDGQELNYKYQNGSELSTNSVQKLIANLSYTLAQTIYCLINSTGRCDEPKVPEPDADAQLVDELLHCYLDTMDCPVFRAAANKPSLDSKRASLYVGVNGWSNPIARLTGLTLALLINQTVNRTKEKCHDDDSDRVFKYIWMGSSSIDSDSSGFCIKTTMNFSLAVSPAFYDIPDYDWASGRYSTWTESVWREMTVRMFLKPSRSHENLTFSLGVVVLSLSFLIVYFANSRSHILFGNTLVTSSC